VADNADFTRFLASWALVHETADEGWKSAVARGNAQEPGDMDSGAEAFVDGLSAIIADRKEQLKAELAAGAEGGEASRAGVGEHLDELRFEVAELRGRFESMQASLDAILERTKGPAFDGPADKA
jgi:predicted aminopeptidase